MRALRADRGQRQSYLSSKPGHRELSKAVLSVAWRSYLVLGVECGVLSDELA